MLSPTRVSAGSLPGIAPSTRHGHLYVPFSHHALPFSSPIRRNYTFNMVRNPSKFNIAVAASSTPTTAKSKTKRPTVTDLRERVAELEAENSALRETLATLQNCAPEDVQIVETRAQPTETLATAEQLKQHMKDAPIVENVTPPLSLSTQEFIKQLESNIKWPSSTAFWQSEDPPYSTLVNAPERESSIKDTNNDTSPTSPLHIVHVTAEMAPHAKVGGLGDVVTGLTKACLARGHTVDIILPFYECLDTSVISNLQLEATFDCPTGKCQDGMLHSSTLRTQVWTGVIEGCHVVLIRPDWEATGSGLFKGSRIYGGSYNEAEAYLYFCRAVLEYLVMSNCHPDVLHAHEWQAAAVPMMFWECSFHTRLSNTKPIFTIHNMDSSGECRQDEFAATGFDGNMFATVERALDERTIGHNPERLCLLKGGIVYSSIVTTVSPNYASETLKGGAAGWLKSTLARPDIAAKYAGVLNGIDTEMWNPATDPFLPARYSALAPQGKALCKKYLLQGLGLNIDADKPLVAVISRLVPQKGIHLIEHAVGRTLELGGQFVLLGAGHADGGLRRMSGELEHTGNVKMVFGYSERLAHLIYAAADVFLVPSMFEPCGLTQMIALRYGGVPVVRKTGGLADTVLDIDTDSSGDAVPPNGFVFEGIDGASLNSALDRALNLYNSNKDEWEGLVLRNLKESERWSWQGPAASYIELYKGLKG